MIVIFAPHVIDRYTYWQSTDRPGIYRVLQTISRPGSGAAIYSVCQSLGADVASASECRFGVKERFFLNGSLDYRGDTVRRPLDRWRKECQAAARRLRPAKVWILANYEQAFDRDFAAGLIDLARERGIITVCDPHRFDPGVFAGCDVLKTNDLAAADRELATHTLVTRGADGMVLFGAEYPAGRYVPAVRVKEVDATGCGDTVSAVLAIELARGAGILQASQRAAELAAVQATLGPGVMPLPEPGMMLRASP